MATNPDFNDLLSALSAEGAEFLNVERLENPGRRDADE